MPETGMLTKHVGIMVEDSSKVGGIKLARVHRLGRPRFGSSIVNVDRSRVG